MIDYTRIMMCLYAAIIKNNGKEIQNFDFATSSLKIDDIILAMKEEQDALPFNVIKKKKFDTVDPYGMDAITFILAITLLYKITGENLEEETKMSEAILVNALEQLVPFLNEKNVLELVVRGNNKRIKSIPESGP
ncbi:MAG: hypothetical protein ACLS4A_01750 [Oscillospiraceae bacterium]